MRVGHSLKVLTKLVLAAGLCASAACPWLRAPACHAGGLDSPAIALNPEPEQDLEQELLALTNQERAEQGLPALIPDEALVRIARRHSIGMAEQGFISHELPSGDLRARMSRAGYRHLVARENVAVAPTVLKAQNALIDSLGHKNNILARDVSRVGIGIARCKPPFEKELFITEIFADPREELHAATLQDLYIDRIQDSAHQMGAHQMRVQPILRDPRLEKMASRSVRSLTIPLQKEELQRVLADSAGELRNADMPQLSRIDMDVQLLRNPKSLKVPSQVREGEARSFGTAVRQVLDNRNQTAYLVLTLIGYNNF